MKNVHHQENCSRRDTLVIKGIKDIINETEEKLREEVLGHIFREKLQVELTNAYHVHGIGSLSSDKPRRVILCLSSFNLKSSTAQL